MSHFLIVAYFYFSYNTHYFETTPEKSPCDGIGATAKTQMQQPYLEGNHMTNEFLKKKLSAVCQSTYDSRVRQYQHSRRTVIWVPRKVISREDTYMYYQVLVGKRKVHVARPTGIIGKLEVKKLSCQCQ